MNKSEKLRELNHEILRVLSAPLPSDADELRWAAPSKQREVMAAMQRAVELYREMLEILGPEPSDLVDLQHKMGAERQIATLELGILAIRMHMLNGRERRMDRVEEIDREIARIRSGASYRGPDKLDAQVVLTLLADERAKLLNMN